METLAKAEDSAYAPEAHGRAYRRRRRRLLPTLAVAVVLILGCGFGEVPVGGAESSPTAGVPEEEPDTATEFEQDIQGAVSVAEAYWEDVFTSAGVTFQPIRRVFPYQQDGEVACGQEAIPRNNAVYCSAGDFIAYDVNWALAAFQKIGDAFIFYLLGHEYAHGAQIRFGLRYEFTIEQELQADCMAGAYINGSVDAKRLELEEGDIEELRTGLLAVADDPGQPWFAEGAHGTAEQRTDAFFAGYRGTLEACDIG